MLYPLAVYGESLYNNRNTVKSKSKEFHIMIEFLTADTSSTASLSTFVKHTELFKLLRQKF